MERLKKIGSITVLSSKEVPFPRLGIGFEKPDRAVFDPRKAYDLGGCSLISGGFVRPENGAKAYACWFPADLMTTDFESTVTFEVAVKGLIREKIRLVDPMDGSVYTVPDTVMKSAANGHVLRFEHLPVRDYPLFLTFGDFVGVTEE